MELRQYLRLVRVHWRVIVLSVAACAGAAATLAWSRTPLYAAESRFFVSTSSSRELSESYAGALYSQQRVRSYAELVSAPPVVSAVIERLGVRYTVEELQSRIRASIPSDTVLIDITVEDPSPRLAHAIAAALTVEFPRFIARLETSAERRAPSVRVNVAEPPRLPEAPVSPNKLLYLLLGAQLGLLLGLGAAVLREALAPSVETAPEAAPPPSGRRTPVDTRQEADDREPSEGEPIESRPATVGVQHSSR